MQPSPLRLLQGPLMQYNAVSVKQGCVIRKKGKKKRELYGKTLQLLMPQSVNLSPFNDTESLKSCVFVNHKIAQQ